MAVAGSADLIAHARVWFDVTSQSIPLEYRGYVVKPRHLLVAAALIVPSLLFGAGSASAAPAQTETVTEHGGTETFPSFLPSCTASNPYTITVTYNQVFHTTLLPNGTEHDTFTQTGTFVAVPLISGQPTYTGKFTVWGGFNLNQKTVDGTFTFNAHGTGSDGSTLNNHTVEHFNEVPDGTVHEFFRCH